MGADAPGRSTLIVRRSAKQMAGPEENAMAQDWRSVIRDPEEKRLFEALASPQWDFRTIDGLVEETGLSPKRVRAIIGKYPSLIRRSLVPDREGRDLYTLSSKSQGLREWFSVTRAITTKST
jgi:hypothetical protein